MTGVKLFKIILLFFYNFIKQSIKTILIPVLKTCLDLKKNRKGLADLEINENVKINESEAIDDPKCEIWFKQYLFIIYTNNNIQ